MWIMLVLLFTLLDMVVIGGGYVPFSTPWKDIGDLAQKAGIPALACLNYNGVRGVTRPPEASTKLQREHIRAAELEDQEHLENVSKFYCKSLPSKALTIACLFPFSQ